MAKRKNEIVQVDANQIIISNDNTNISPYMFNLDRVDKPNCIMCQSPIDCDQGIEIIKEQIRKLAMVPQMLADIRNRIQQNQEAS